MNLIFVGKQSRGSDPVPSVCVYNDDTNTTLTALFHICLTSFSITCETLHIDFTCIEDAVQLFHRSIYYI